MSRQAAILNGERGQVSYPWTAGMLSALLVLLGMAYLLAIVLPRVVAHV